MTTNTIMDRLRALEAEIRRLQASARIERATSWVNGTGHAKAAEYARRAELCEALHTEGCRQWSGSVDERIKAALKLGCFILGLAIAAGC